MSILAYNCLEQPSKMKVKIDPNGMNIQLYQGCMQHAGDTENIANLKVPKLKKKKSSIKP